MLGFFIGSVCLIGLIKVGLRGHHGHGHCGGGHHGHHGRWHGHGRYGRGYGRGEGEEGRGFGERAMLRWVFERLDTTHGQEKVIIEAVEELREPFKKARSQAGSTFDDFAQAMRGEGFDHGRVAGTWVSQDKALEELRVALTAAMARVHEVLDEKQRKILGDLIERRGGGRPDFI